MRTLALLVCVLLSACATTPQSVTEVPDYDPLDLEVWTHYPTGVNTVGQVATWVLETTERTHRPYRIHGQTDPAILARPMSPEANAGGAMTIRNALSAACGSTCSIETYPESGLILIRSHDHAPPPAKAKTFALPNRS